MRNERDDATIHPELIRQVTSLRKKQREAIEAKKLLQQRSPGEIVQEVAKAKAEQIEANEMFRKMRTDCEDLLNSQGVIRRVSFSESEDGIASMLTKHNVLETLIPDENGEEVKVILLSNKEPARSSEINLVIGKLPFYDSDFRFSLSLRRDQSYIVQAVGIKEKRKRKPNLQDARQWKEVVDAIKEQRQ